MKQAIVAAILRSFLFLFAISSGAVAADSEWEFAFKLSEPITVGTTSLAKGLHLVDIQYERGRPTFRIYRGTATYERSGLLGTPRFSESPELVVPAGIIREPRLSNDDSDVVVIEQPGIVLVLFQDVRGESKTMETFIARLRRSH